MAEIKFSRLTAIAVVLAFAATAAAQNQVQPRPPVGQPANQPAGQAERAGQPGMGQPDSTLANWLIVDNEGEVALGEFAQERAADKDVKEFAKEMAEAHKKMIGDLERFAGRQAGRDGDRRRDPNRRDEPRRSEPGAAASPSQGATGGNQPATAATASRPAGGRLDFVSLKRELGQQCLATARRELDSKKDAEFDKCYMHQQVGMHLHAIDTMQVFKNHASPEFAQALTEGIQTAQKHLEHAKKISHRLDDSAAAETARREK